MPREKDMTCRICGRSFRHWYPRACCSDECTQQATTDRRRAWRHRKTEEALAMEAWAVTAADLATGVKARTCCVCGASLAGKQPNAVICGAAECVRQYERDCRAVRVERRKPVKVCVICGREFRGGRTDRLTCSDACRVKRIAENRKRRKK